MELKRKRSLESTATLEQKKPQYLVGQPAGKDQYTMFERGPARSQELEPTPSATPIARRIDVNFPRQKTWEEKVDDFDTRNKIEYYLRGNRAQRMIGQQMLEERRLKARDLADQAVRNDQTRARLAIDRQQQQHDQTMAELQNENQRLTAELAARKERDIANINAQSQENLALINTGAQERIANTEANTQYQIAKDKNASEQAIANIQATANLEGARMQQAGVREGQLLQAIIADADAAGKPVDYNQAMRAIALISQIENKGMKDEDIVLLTAQINNDSSLSAEEKRARIQALRDGNLGKAGEFLPYLINIANQHLQPQQTPSTPQPVNKPQPIIF